MSAARTHTHTQYPHIHTQTRTWHEHQDGPALPLQPIIDVRNELLHELKVNCVLVHARQVAAGDLRACRMCVCGGGQGPMVRLFGKTKRTSLLQPGEGLRNMQPWCVGAR